MIYFNILDKNVILRDISTNFKHKCTGSSYKSATTLNICTERLDECTGRQNKCAKRLDICVE